MVALRVDITSLEQNNLHIPLQCVHPELSEAASYNFTTNKPPKIA